MTLQISSVLTGMCFTEDNSLSKVIIRLVQECETISIQLSIPNNFIIHSSYFDEDFHLKGTCQDLKNFLSEE